MTHEQNRKAAFDPGDYPALLEFLPAYLHQDFGEEYGSAEKAIAALVADASGDQIRNIRDEWHALRQALAGRPLHEMQRTLGVLGAAWQPQSEHELEAVDEILRRSEA
jgi:hypothetical protein